jgi:hypothetical protein
MVVLCSSASAIHSVIVRVLRMSLQDRLELRVAAGVVGDALTRPLLEGVHAVDAFAEVLPERLFRRHEQDVAVGRFVYW